MNVIGAIVGKNGYGLRVFMSKHRVAVDKIALTHAGLLRPE